MDLDYNMAVEMSTAQATEAWRNGREIEYRMISDTMREVVVFTTVNGEQFYCLITVNQYNMPQQPSRRFDHKNISELILNRNKK